MRMLIIGAGEASPFLVFNVEIMSVCLTVVMDTGLHTIGVVIIYQLLSELLHPVVSVQSMCVI